MFLAAADHTASDPDTTAVVEDATSGVAAGAAGGFAMVIGIDRGGNRDSLLAAGAHLVVDDLDETLTRPDSSDMS
jgi:beta-phosphoglucomutase-like phosphatase (HAD superfamily)